MGSKTATQKPALHQNLIDTEIGIMRMMKMNTDIMKRNEDLQIDRAQRQKGWVQGEANTSKYKERTVLLELSEGQICQEGGRDLRFRTN